VREPDPGPEIPTALEKYICIYHALLRLALGEYGLKFKNKVSRKVECSMKREIEGNKHGLDTLSLD